MSDHTGIEWTDATWNPTTGCTKISPGCAHCYIERTPAFRIKGRRFVNGVIPLETHANRLEQPLHWRKPRRVFVNSLSDLFHEDVPDTFIDQVFAVMALAQQHTFQILTKRAERMQKYMTDWPDGAGRRHHVRWQAFQIERRRAGKSGDWSSADVEHQNSVRSLATWPLDNVWLGVSVENQHFADERIPLLLQTPAAVRFISAEPLLGPVDLRRLNIGVRQTGYGKRLIERDALTPWETQYHGMTETRTRDSVNRGTKLEWVIVGGESGPGARPFDVAWARSIVQQCKAAGVACFVKQLGTSPIFPDGGGWEWPEHDKKGGDPAEWPSDLRVREWPSTDRSQS